MGISLLPNIWTSLDSLNDRLPNPKLVIMAKGARASTIKTNNSKLKSRVFGPVETARTERLSQKLLELASQPKPKAKDVDIMMDTETGMRYVAQLSLHF